MTSLPSSASSIGLQSSDLSELPIGLSSGEDERSLLRAFRSFGETAASLEHAYEKLRSEVERLKRELAASNSELARTSEENRRSRDQLDGILEGLPCGVLVVSRPGEILRANPESLKMLGAHLPDGGLRSVSELPDRVRELLDLSREADGELEMMVTDAEPRRWLACGHALLQDGSSIFSLRDTSERKRLDEIEARLQRDEQLSSISALLAHEIRNPLGSLELFAGLLIESELDSEQRRWVEHVQAGLRTLAATVNNVLHFHSLPEPQRTPVDLGRLLEWAREFFGPLARQSGLTLSLQNGVSGYTLTADRNRLEQVLANLILNGIHATASGGWIELGGRIDESNATAILSVVDTGSGIRPEDLNHIFEPGFHRRQGGAGLGLAVCRKIVGQHGGTIQAANRSSGGATFTLTFPLSSGADGGEQ
ncbi:MAG TPA: ATP-binding protein [Dongiaceae bacterium]|nr:ATP-binding protein [Dongiaceae bacterium]